MKEKRKTWDNLETDKKNHHVDRDGLARLLRFSSHR